MKIKNVLISIFIMVFSLNTFSAESKGNKRGGKGWRESYGGDSAIAEFKFKASDIFNFTSFDKKYSVETDVIKEIIRDSEINCISSDFDSEVSKNYYIVSYLPNSIIYLDCKVWNKVLNNNAKEEIAIESILNILRHGKFDPKEAEEVFKKYKNFKLRKYGEIEKESLTTLNYKLFIAIMECSNEKYYKLIELGADIYDNADNSELNLLSRAIESGCKEITMDLLKNNLPFKYDLEGMSLFMKVALDYDQKLFSFEDRKTILKAIVERDSQFVNVKIPASLNFISDLGVDNFYVGYGCEVGSGPLHFWSSGSLYQSMSKDIITGNYKITDERDYHLENIKFFKELGFSDNLKNVCGKTARDLFLKSGI